MSTRAQSLSVADVGALDEKGFVGHFAGVYEHSPWVARGAWRRRPFADFEALAGAFETVVDEAPEDARLGLVRAHPELGGREARKGTLTEESAAEQVGAGLDRLTAEQLRRLEQVNRAYAERFRFPLVISVRGRDPNSILDEGEARLRNSAEQELNRAIAQITRIARLRLHDLVADDDGTETSRPQPRGK
ncbi:MAG: 2-oxo-4-hydroxy-4-carboxy-5-ureidoimidazoline decarboxylase [Solirubrobacterales bacterium]|nr:2-oxo-4-hydroxy-4-carboxy-5-ureidoimidazoline decarboxylase [Solirubrobacterales bacterium]MBV9715242.1 2-oxo-4-hydroxy-4-carboxy-5-ureidoimidazoline decarboxylase [Solirubrobacterales bacterium]